MINGINLITDDKGRTTGILLDLATFKTENTTASEVLNSLQDLQKLIDQTEPPVRRKADWSTAKDVLSRLKDQ